MVAPNVANWRALPAFIVRPSGFSFGRLAALRFVRSIAALDDLAAATRDRVAAGTAFDVALSQERYGSLPEFDDPVARKQFSKHVKRARAFGRREIADLPADSLAETVRVVPTLAALAADLRDQHVRVAAATRALDSVFASELDERRATLRALYADDERLRESVFLESPEAFERVQQLVAADGPRDARARQRERLATMYLQRFCAKNDTNSICGPHGVAWLLDRPTTPRIAIESEGERRRSYFSHWAAERLLEAAAVRAGQAAVVPVRVNPTARLVGSTITWCAIEHDATVSFRRRYGRANLDPTGVELIRMLADRPRPIAELIKLGDTAEEITALVDEMCEAGILNHRVTLAAGLFHPLEKLIETLESWPDEEPRQWGQDQARSLEALIAGFAESRLSERVTIYRQMVDRFREATGDSAERGQGRHYADRTIIHEDCHAALRADIGAETIGPLLEGLVPLVHAASLPLELVRETVREWFRERFGEGKRISALDAHRAFDEDRATERATHTADADALRAAIERVRACFSDALARAGTGPASVPAAVMAAAVAGMPGSTRPGYVSVDLMLAGHADKPALVLGEVHGFFWLPTCLLDVVPEPQRGEVVAHMRSAMRELAGGQPTVECLFAHTQATDRRFPITDADLLLIDPGDRPSVGLGQLDVMLEGNAFRFLDGEREVVPVTAYTTYPFFLYTSKLAPLIDDFAGKFFPESLLPESVRTGDAPRISVENLTFRRRTWRRPAVELRELLGAGKNAALLSRAQELRARLDCPAIVFVSFSNEPKPVLVDFDNFFLVETFAHLLERQAPEATVRITEMLPGPDELFAVGPDGTRTSELRMGFYRLGG